MKLTFLIEAIAFICTFQKITCIDLPPKKWRVGGIIEVMNFMSPRVEIIEIQEFFKDGGKLGEFIRKADNFLTTTQVTGQITIELPNGETGVIASFNEEYLHFAQPIYFSFEYESLAAGSTFNVKCDLKVPGSDRIVCDGTHEYSSQSPFTMSQKHPSESTETTTSNAIRRHLAPFKKHFENINPQSNEQKIRSATIDIIVKIMHMYGYEKLYKSQGASTIEETLKQLLAFPELFSEATSPTEKIELTLELLRNITGAFLINLNTHKVKESGQQPHRIEGYWGVSKADVNDHVEGFGQLYLLPEATIFSLGDFAEPLDVTLPDVLTDIEIPFVHGPAFPLFELRRSTQSENDYEFNYNLQNRFSAKFESDTPNKYIVFANLWDSDGDGALSFDDCLAKGNAFGLEQVDVSPGQHQLSQCDNDKDVFSTFYKQSEAIVDTEANLIWYKIDGSLAFNGGSDDPGGDCEPYGKLQISVGDRSINQKFVIWEQSRDLYSWLKDSQNYTLPFTIQFREKQDFLSSAGNIQFHGNVMEDNRPSSDKLIADYDNYAIQVNNLEEGQKYQFDFKAYEDTHWAKISMQIFSMEVHEPPEEHISYQLTGRMEMKCDSDAGVEHNYEAYGDLTVDIGLLLENQNINLWHRNRNDYIKTHLGSVTTIEFSSIEFKESKMFTDPSQTGGKLVTWGSVKESDAGTGANDDYIGNYDGAQFTPSDLIIPYAQHFQQDSDDYVDLTFQITPIVSLESSINEYILEGTLYIFEEEDTGTSYEPYGYLNVDIGDKLANKGREMWYRTQSNHLSVQNGHGHTIKLTDIKFTESSNFMDLDQTQNEVQLHSGWCPIANKMILLICDDPWEKSMFQDVDVQVQVRFVPELGRQRLETCLFPTDHHISSDIEFRDYFTDVSSRNVHGYVKEDDGSTTDEDIGRYEGVSYYSYELDGKGRKQLFRGKGAGSYVVLTLRMYNLTKQKSTTKIVTENKKKYNVIPKKVDL